MAMVNDIIIGAPGIILRSMQDKHMIYGQSTPLELSSLNGTNGFIINGIDLGDNAGYSVASAGDLNSGGKDAPNAGQAHVIYGEVFE